MNGMQIAKLVRLSPANCKRNRFLNSGPRTECLVASFGDDVGSGEPKRGKICRQRVLIVADDVVVASWQVAADARSVIRMALQFLSAYGRDDLLIHKIS